MAYTRYTAYMLSRVKSGMFLLFMVHGARGIVSNLRKIGGALSGLDKMQWRQTHINPNVMDFSMYLVFTKLFTQRSIQLM